MNAILLIIIVFLAYIAAYRIYGKYLSKRIFNVSDNNLMPSSEFSDGIDYVPTRKSIVFGHHFTTIAGLGPIVGPAIGIIWGWLPALLWVVLGSIFMGALHDYSTLMISARNKGKTIGELSGSIINSSSRLAFQFIMQILLMIVLSVFALIVSTLFAMYPESVIPIWGQIPIAIFLGYAIKKGGNEIFLSVIALILMYGSIYLGILFPVDLSKIEVIRNLTDSPVELSNIVAIIWCVILFIYVSIASILPVGFLLQPRDFINSLQLFLAIIIILLGVFVANPDISAPAINHIAFAPDSDVPSMMPLLFIIIACGAISGFHSIASSGTTVKQVKKESDALIIGYGSMLAEGFLAVLVLVCVSAGLGLGLETKVGILTGADAFQHYYSSWASSQGGVAANIHSFVVGASNFIREIGIPKEYAIPAIAVFIVSFANTTLDSATRIQRLSLQELMGSIGHSGLKLKLSNRYITTFIVVLLAAIITFLKPGGTGAKLLWPLFGSLNQLLAALGLAVVSLYLHKKGKNFIITALPMIFILIMTLWAMFDNLIRAMHNHEILLIVLTIIILLLTAWLLISSVSTIIKHVRS